MHDFKSKTGGEFNVNMPGQPRVLIVDDEASVGVLLKKVLTNNSFEATIAESGRDALELLGVQDFEVALLDIGLPDMSGIELLQRVSREYPDTSFLMATGLADVHAAVESMKLGASDYLTKPFDLEDMLSRVEKALERKYLEVMAKDYHERLESRVSDQSEQLKSMTTNAVEKLMRGIVEKPEPAIREIQERNRPQAANHDPKESSSWIMRRFGVGTR